MLAWFGALIALTFACAVGGLYYFVLKPAVDEVAATPMVNATQQAQFQLEGLVGQIQRVVLMALFEGEFEATRNGYVRANYDVSADGQRFLMIQAATRQAPPAVINIVLNWSEELKRLVPTN